MFFFTSAILLFSLQSTFAAPVALPSSNPSLNANNATHQHSARDIYDLCPMINSVQMSWKSSGKLKFRQSKATVQLDGANVRLEHGIRCVYPILSEWPGLPKGVSAAAVLPIRGSTRPSDLAILSRFTFLMETSGDLIQRDVTGDYKQWIIIDRSGKHITETRRWKNFFSRDGLDPIHASDCENIIFPKILKLLVAQIKTDNQRNMIYDHINFDRVLFDDNWTTARFIDWPLYKDDQRPRNDVEINEMVAHLDIQARDGYYEDDDGQEIEVDGTCYSDNKNAVQSAY